MLAVDHVVDRARCDDALPEVLDFWVAPSASCANMGRSVGNHDSAHAAEAADAFTERFVSWLTDGRGDSARGRHRQALMLLDSAWGRPGWPLHDYRPRRDPGAFLALVSDLALDLRYRTGEKALGAGGRIDSEHARLRAFLRERLMQPWTLVLEDIRALGWWCVASQLESVTRSALKQPDGGDEPLALALAHLGVDPGARRDEHHPVAGDLRRALRLGLDEPWSAALDDHQRSDLVGFLATWPTDPLALLSEPGVADEFGELDFAVFYALVTDARAPGRRWWPPAALVPEERESREHFAAMAGRLDGDAVSRREQRLLRLGLSATFPGVVARLDALLASPSVPRALHHGEPWGATVDTLAERVELARRAFLARVGEKIGGAS